MMCGPVFAGPSAKEVIPPPPPPEPALWNWFIGGSAGYLFDFEEPMYHAHLGIEKSCNDISSHALFLEVGWTEKDDTYLSQPIFVGDFRVRLGLTSDIEIVPVTLNYKYERMIANRLNFYIGAGVGIAFVDYDATLTAIGSPAAPVSTGDSDEVFAAQVFTGLVFDVTEHFEIYGGARWIHIDDGDIMYSPIGVQPLEDDFLGELGIRFNF
ncbi:hypothetical protein Hhel01_04112 [Haloferula helveola]